MVLHLLGIGKTENEKRKTENLFEWEGKNGKVWHTPSASLVPLPQGDNGGRSNQSFQSNRISFNVKLLSTPSPYGDSLLSQGEKVGDGVNCCNHSLP